MAIVVKDYIAKLNSEFMIHDSRFKIHIPCKYILRISHTPYCVSFG